MFGRVGVRGGGFGDWMGESTSCMIPIQSLVEYSSRTEETHEGSHSPAVHNPT